ncbi:hypothetical protein OS493_030029 [Desmophyllum pertusum]|uniref:Uncharacterized protein n=1 Tax=Desmophyllum pertusum TaxID=174260 RepID=A0A9W9ZKJ6_9CNID|nr:hypothetical protein OS493_030029 [Desmophyllum pertusum]
MPVSTYNAAVTSHVDPNIPVLRKDVQSKLTTDGSSRNSVNPFCKAAKGSEYAQHRPLPFVPVSTVPFVPVNTVLSGSQMAQYTNQAHYHNSETLPSYRRTRILEQNSVNKWFGY